MSENKKKVNIIDIGVVLIILVFIAGIGVRFFHSTSKSLKNDITLEYTVSVKDVRQYTIDALKKSSTITDYSTDEELGEIISMSEVIPHTTEGIALNGEFVPSEVPSKYETTLTIKSKARKTNSRYFLTDDIEVSLGRDFAIISKYVQTTGKITSIKEIPSEK